MASTKNDADTPKTSAVKKWNGDVERDLCLAMLIGNGGEGDKGRNDWNMTHSVMTSLGYDFTKDAMWYVCVLRPMPPLTLNDGTRS